VKYDEKKSNKMDDQLKAFMQKSTTEAAPADAEVAADAEAAAPELAK
jgi:hypothetical protein